MGAGYRKWILVAALAAGAIFLVDAWRYSGYQLDDSFITFRYARNLVGGHGLVFNPGERVEGYTNLLFVLLSAAFIGVGIDPLLGTTIVTTIAGLAALAFTLGLCREVMWRREVERGTTGSSVDAVSPAQGSGRVATEMDRHTALAWALLAPGFLLTTEAFAYWSVVSMETMLFTALLASGLFLLVRTIRTGRGGVLLTLPFVLLVLTRPDGAAVALIAFTVAALTEHRRRGDWSHLRALAPAAAITSAAIAALFAWRLAYYGRLVPNTFNAKVTGGAGPILTGLAYLRDWSLASPLLAAAILAPLTLLSSRVRARLGREHPVGLLWAVALFVVASGVVLGGDSMPFFRFFVPAMPLLAVVAAVGISSLHDRRPRLAWIAPVALLVCAVASHITIQPYRAFVAHRTSVVGAAVGKWFARALPAGGLMAINTVGALPWESRLPTIDMLGLTDAAIASRPVWVASAGWAGHRRGWGAYVMGRRPAAILWYNSAGSAEPFYLGDRELAADPHFRFFYRQRIARLPALDQGADAGIEEPEQSSIDGNSSGEDLQTRADSSEVSGKAQGRPGEEDPNVEDPGGGDPDGEGAGRTPGRRPNRVGSARVLARFPGYPFGFHPSGSSIAPELGVRAVFRDTPIPHTTFVEHPITVHWFELDPRDAGLWPLRERHGQAIGPFVQDVAAAWQQGVGEPPGDPDAAAFVEALCRDAYKQVEAGDYAGAKMTLARAAAANLTARVPIVYQYMANVAVVTGDLLAAVPAQKEALRLEPENRLYAQNLARLLTAPFGDAPGMAQVRDGIRPGKRGRRP